MILHPWFGAGGAGRLRVLLVGTKGDGETPFGRWVQGERNLPRVVQGQDP